MPLYIPSVLLEINGSPASADLLNDLLEISVEESLTQPAMFTIIINNNNFSGNSDIPWKHQSQFAIGKSIKVGFTSSTTEDPDFSQENTGYVIDGEITAMETELNEKSQAPIIIRGYDISHRLHRGRYNRSFQNVKDSDIVTRVTSEAGIASTVTATTITHEYVFQENQTNMEFLRERAARNGFELYVQDAKLNFRKPTQDQELTLTWLEDIHSFRVRVTSTEQVSSVEVRGWDYVQKKAIVSTASTGEVITTTQVGTGQQASTKFSSKPKMIVVDQPVFSINEAQKIAQSLCDELGGEFVHADAKGEGNPKIRPGRVIKMIGIGIYSGSYYVSETRHSFQAGVYTTHFSVRSLRGGNLFSMLSSKPHLKPGQTMLVGVVSNNKDPKAWGRVRVKFPTLTEQHESNWARVVSVGAGPTRGFDCLPEVNDEVLVAFEHGDIHRPYVIGGVWNGKDTPPAPIADSVVNGKVRLRTFKTRVGHQLQFVEEDKDTKKGIYLSTIGGHNVRLNDTDKQIQLTSTGDIIIKTGTTGTTKDLTINAANITLTATTKITLKVGSNKVEISNSGIVIEGMQVEIKGTVSSKIEAPMVNVEASGINTIKGSLVKIN